MKNTTCGHLYADAKRIAAQAEDQFSAGFLVGQIEKVYLGACRACMTKNMGLHAIAEQLVRKVYDGLVVTIVQVPGHSDELWVSAGTLPFMDIPTDSPRSHLLRAAWCGIPAEEIDLEFHRRFTNH